MPKIIKNIEGLEIVEEIRAFTITRDANGLLYRLCLEYFSGVREEYTIGREEISPRVAQIAEVGSERFDLSDYVLNLAGWQLVGHSETIWDSTAIVDENNNVVGRTRPFRPQANPPPALVEEWPAMDDNEASAVAREVVRRNAEAAGLEVGGSEVPRDDFNDEWNRTFARESMQALTSDANAANNPQISDERIRDIANRAVARADAIVDGWTGSSENIPQALIEDAQRVHQAERARAILRSGISNDSVDALEATTHNASTYKKDMLVNNKLDSNKLKEEITNASVRRDIEILRGNLGSIIDSIEI